MSRNSLEKLCESEVLFEDNLGARVVNWMPVSIRICYFLCALYCSASGQLACLSQIVMCGLSLSCK